MAVYSFIRGFEDHYTCFRLMFNESVTNPSEEVIHRMRVEMKYLVTLLNFIDECYDDAVDNDYGTLIKKIAKKSGKIRDWQIIRALFESHPMYKNAEMVEMIDMKIARRQDKYKDFAATLEVEKNVTDSLNLKGFIITETVICNYINGLNQRSKELLSTGVQNREYWHKARHLLKRSFFLMNLANALFDKCYSVDDIQYYRGAEQLIGRWHDLTLIIDFCDNQQIPVSDVDAKKLMDSEKEIMSKLVGR